MTRYGKMFEGLRARGDGAFGAFVMLGDPGIAESAALLDALVEGGADMVEVGIPFSDPVADGPVIEAAGRRARDAGVRASDCLDLIAGFRARHPAVPIGILTYANLVMSRGRSDYLRDIAKAGADSLLIADLPSIEAAPWAAEMVEAGIAPVLIAAANTPDRTLATIARLARGYTYCVSRAGITGVHAAGTFDAGLVARVRAADAPPPIFGFGISTPAHVKAALATGAVGVICGSAIVRIASDGPGAVAAFVQTMKQATVGQLAFA